MLSVKCPRGHDYQAADLRAVARGCPVCLKSAPKMKSRSAQRPERLAEPLTRRIVIPISVLSQNKTTYAHWSAYNKDKGRWVDRLSPWAGQLGGRYVWSSWRLTREWAPPHREFDYGNLVGGFKPVLDCLTELNVIEDDRPACFKADYQQVRGPVTQTVIELLDYRLKENA